jgi:NADPH:quinone reductase-like Zn-dependent oxidoreductase
MVRHPGRPFCETRLVTTATRITVPPVMTAAYVTALGGPELIRIGELPVPEPGVTDVLVEVDAVAVNPVDTLVRSGRYPTPTPFPFVVGRDLVGTVRLVGSHARDFKPGDRMWCNSLGHGGRQGSFARFAVVPAERAYHLPPGVDPVTAVAVAHPAATAYLAWFVHAGLRPAQTVYVGGAAGNVGRAAVQTATAAGARVIAGARPADHAACIAAGAAATVDFQDPRLARRLADLAPDGIDVFWNTSTHHDLDVAVHAVTTGGKVLITAGTGADAALPVRPFYVRDISLHGFVISRASAGDLAGAARLINRMLGAGTLTTRVVEQLPLSETAEAHRRLESGTVRGRIVVRP